MKKAILFLTLLSVCGSLSAGVPYFCNQPGKALYYERYEVGTGKLLQTTVLDFVSVSPKGDGETVEYGMLISKANGRAMFGGRAPLTADISAGGDLWMDLGASTRIILSNYFPKAKVTSESALSVLPSEMMPGDTLADAHAVVMLGAFKCTVDITDRTVLRTEQIKTPAGVFDAMVVREFKVEKAPMHNKQIWTDSWYVRGLGYVRHDSFDKKMRLISSEILIRIDTL